MARCLQVLLLTALVASAAAGCPFAGRKSLVNSVKMPEAHPSVDTAAGPSRKLQQATPVSASYVAAMRLLVADFEKAIGRCQMSPEGMAYNDGTAGQLIQVDSDGVFFPAATWLRAFFHDAGTFVKNPSNGGRRGGPNGSLGVGCTTNPCGVTTGANSPMEAQPGSTCPNGDKAVSGFSNGKSYCCPLATQCLSHGQSPNNPVSGAGLTIPVCLTGNQTTVELCRAENFNLLPTVQFFRGRQNNPIFHWTDDAGVKRPVSFADMLVAGAAVAVKQCSAGALNLTITMGRPEATVADDHPLPSPAGVIDDKHNSIFQSMGLNKVDMVTMVVGSHSIGGFRALSSPDLTGCPFVPFDCTTSGQTSNGAPFDNNVFKVACNGVRGVVAGTCEFNTRCTNPSVDETAQGCPFTGPARAGFAACNPNSYPAPGLTSDVFLCQENTETRQRMVQYANSQSFFFKSYAAGFDKMAAMGFEDSDLTLLV